MRDYVSDREALKLFRLMFTKWKPLTLVSE